MAYDLSAVGREAIFCMDTVGLVLDWLQADKERLMRKREFGLAMVIAKPVAQLGVVSVEGDIGWMPADGGDTGKKTPEYYAAIKRANDARALFKQSAARAGALRGAITKRLKGRLVEPTPNTEINELYAALCERERADAANYAQGDY